MSDNPPKEQLHAWCVALIHGSGAPMVNVIIAPSSVAATALVMRQGYVQVGVPKEDLTGVGVNEITLDWLRRAVHALETGQTSGQVLSLVPQTPPPELAEQQTVGAQGAAALRQAMGMPPDDLQNSDMRAGIVGPVRAEDIKWPDPEPPAA